MRDWAEGEGVAAQFSCVPTLCNAMRCEFPTLCDVIKGSMWNSRECIDDKSVVIPGHGLYQYPGWQE